MNVAKIKRPDFLGFFGRKASFKNKLLDEPCTKMMSLRVERNYVMTKVRGLDASGPGVNSLSDCVNGWFRLQASAQYEIVV